MKSRWHRLKAFDKKHPRLMPAGVFFAYMASFYVIPVYLLAPLHNLMVALGWE
jgi:hypothetical protein